MRVFSLAAIRLAIGLTIISSVVTAADKIPPKGKPGAAVEAPQAGALRPALPAGKKAEVAVFAGGCFWCTEFAFEQVAGVINVESGYCGGTKASANYNMVHRGTTGHAEAIRITYDRSEGAHV